MEELEEANYNQIDGNLNNMKPKDAEQTEKSSLSIMERLEKHKEQLISQKPLEKQGKETAKKPELGIEE